MRANRLGRPARRARPPPASGFAGRSEGRRTGVWVRSNLRPTPAVFQRSAVAHQAAMRGVRQSYLASLPELRQGPLRPMRPAVYLAAPRDGCGP